MLDWIFEGIVTWVSSIVAELMDTVSGLFLDALGTDMTAMEEYFPFVSSAFTVLQYTAWAVLFLITVWQLFRVFGGPITDAENPWTLVARSALFALLIGYAKPIFQLVLDIARAPYTALMDITMTAEDFTFAGLEQALTNGLGTFVAVTSIIGLLLIVILEIALGRNYFKLLLETVERYIVVGVLCYTSPLAFSMGASKATSQVFRSWCRMVGSQLLLLVMNVWFLRGFSSAMGQYIGGGGALSNGQGSVNCRKSFSSRAQSKPTRAIISDRMAVWSRTAGSTAAPSASPTFSRVSSTAKARSESRNTASLDRRNKSFCNGRMAWTRMTPMPFF